MDEIVAKPPSGNDQATRQWDELRRANASLRQEGKRCWLGPLLYWLYGRTRRHPIRSLIAWSLEKLEGGELYSLTLRKVLRKYEGVDVGLYTMGAPFVRNSFMPGTQIGRFCSISWTVRAFNVDHPKNWRSTHAMFFNPGFGLVERDPRAHPPLVIGNDVYIGHNAIILPSVRKIEDGAFIAAGAVVHQDVPPYAIVVGHPARVVRYRFEEELIEGLLASHWWDKPLEELRLHLDEFCHPLGRSILDK